MRISPRNIDDIARLKIEEMNEGAGVVEPGQLDPLEIESVDGAVGLRTMALRGRCGMPPGFSRHEVAPPAV